jgi:hypothetical protein
MFPASESAKPLLTFQQLSDTFTSGFFKRFSLHFLYGHAADGCV